MTGPTITNRNEYEEAQARANALGDAPEGSAQADERARLAAAIDAWDKAHEGEQASGPEDEKGLNRSDDLPVSGLPFNLGKLSKD